VHRAENAAAIALRRADEAGGAGTAQPTCRGARRATADLLQDRLRRAGTSCSAASSRRDLPAGRRPLGRAARRPIDELRRFRPAVLQGYQARPTCWRAARGVAWPAAHPDGGADGRAHAARAAQARGGDARRGGLHVLRRPRVRLDRRSAPRSTGST
jgi:hypothetical protein